MWLSPGPQDIAVEAPCCVFANPSIENGRRSASLSHESLVYETALGEHEDVKDGHRCVLFVELILKATKVASVVADPSI